MDGGAWWATVHGVSKSLTRLSNFTFFLSSEEQIFEEIHLFPPPSHFSFLHGYWRWSLSRQDLWLFCELNPGTWRLLTLFSVFGM